MPLPKSWAYTSPNDLPLYVTPSRRSRRQPLVIAVRIITSTLSLRILCALIAIPTLYILSGGIPPRYSHIRQFERNLPQHRMPHTDKKYLRFEGTLWGLGLNNILQEQLVLSYIAYSTNRSFVFSDYTWSHLPLPYVLYDWSLRPTTMPLSAFIAGPTSGGDMPSIGLTQDAFNDLTPSETPRDLRAVHVSHFDKVCPKIRRIRFSSTAEPALTDTSLDGDALVRAWVDWLNNVSDDRCVVVDFTEQPVFDHTFFGSERVISVYPLLASTPILRDFKWSPLVQDAVIRNLGGILSASDDSDVIPGLVAVHLRRGDYEGHCRYLLEKNLDYQGMNRYPGVMDRFDPNGFALSKSPSPKLDHYLEHCLPDIDQIVHRLHEIREQNPSLKLKKVYLLSNGLRSWLEQLWIELKKDGWLPLEKGMASSQDLVLTNAEHHVSGAIDMAIAEQTQLFIGNGFSSLSGNILMFRMAKGMDISNNRFL